MQSQVPEVWRNAAMAVKEPLSKPPVPLHILLGEAVDVARFCEHHFLTVRDASGRIIRPGLELAVRGGQFHAGLGAEILELQQALSIAQTEYLLCLSPEPASPAARADFVRAEIAATLQYLFNDGVSDADRNRLSVLQQKHGNPTSQDARAAALDDYAGLAQLHRGRMAGLGGFDVAMIDEAPQLAVKLREQSASKLAGAPLSEQRAALDLRNRLMTLLCERMNIVRSTARFVFRNDPDTLRKATSSYLRRRRADARRSRQEAEPGPADG
jgi:hypothetical protein